MEMRVREEKVTQEAVAVRLHTSDRMLRQWITDFKVNWSEIKNG
jgi:DNA-binding transcriptional regulator YiaG